MVKSSIRAVRHSSMIKQECRADGVPRQLPKRLGTASHGNWEGNRRLKIGRIMNISIC